MDQRGGRRPIGISGQSRLLFLKTDDQLIALVRSGNPKAFEALVRRYQPRLLAFCIRFMGSQHDAEDVLQESFTSAYNAILKDDRPINVRPWLYRIARNRCLNHLRVPPSDGLDSMDIFETDGGATAAETFQRRDAFREVVADLKELPETQRTALLLREFDELSYQEIAQAMDTTVPSVKSLLVRARFALVEAAQERELSCEDVRLELGRAAAARASAAPPVRRHVKRCDPCRTFRRDLRKANRAARVYPLLPLFVLKRLFGLPGMTASGAGTAASVGTVGAKTAAGMITAAVAAFGGVALTEDATHKSTEASRPVPVAAAKRAPTVAAHATAARTSSEAARLAAWHPLHGTARQSATSSPAHPHGAIRHAESCTVRWHAHGGGATGAVPPPRGAPSGPLLPAVPMPVPPCRSNTPYRHHPASHHVTPQPYPGPAPSGQPQPEPLPAQPAPAVRSSSAPSSPRPGGQQGESVQVAPSAVASSPQAE